VGGQLQPHCPLSKFHDSLHGERVILGALTPLALLIGAVVIPGQLESPTPIALGLVIFHGVSKKCQ